MKKILIFAVVVSFLFISCDKDSTETTYGTLEGGQGKVIFLELGSESCAPCQLMRPVMDEIVTTYGDEVEVVYFDVWTDEEAHRIEEFEVRVIPTQIFFDKDGEIYYRHEGFLPIENVQEIIDSAL